MKKLITVVAFMLSTFALADAKKLNLAIDGMTCQSCVKNITSHLKALPEVDQVAINLKAGKGVVTLKDGADLKADALEAVIKKAGYSAHVVQ